MKYAEVKLVICAAEAMTGPEHGAVCGCVFSSFDVLC